MSVLVAGGAGFVGSHFVLAAVEAGERVVVLDDLSAGHREAVPAGVPLVIGDVGDRALVASVLREHEVTAMALFAGRIQVGESVAKPALYWDSNLVRPLALLEVALQAGVSQVLFSSSAAVYGIPSHVPIVETEPCRPINPYGTTKLVFEQVLASYAEAYGLRWAALRYFNAAGAHPSGRLAERHDPETHLIPLALDAALGRRGPLTLFGDDYPTHLAALSLLRAGASLGPVNLGSGRGWSVREVLEATRRVLGRAVPCTLGPRRAGDPAELVADPSLARRLLGWSTKHSELDTILADAARARRAG